jgi:predicted XRE-type DNA-binding protein
MEEPPQQEMSQAEFARTMGVSRAAVSQWKSNDILKDDAFTKPGKKGKLVYSVAVDQVRRNRDIGQSLGNGLNTKADVEPVPQPQPPPAPVPQVAQPDLPVAPKAEPEQEAAPAPAVPRPTTVEDQIKEAKMIAQQRKNRIEAAEEAELKGQLTSTRDARQQFQNIASNMLQLFEGALPDFADSIAEKFDVPQRDVLHLLKEKFRLVRSDAAKRTRKEAEGVDQTVAVDLGGDEEDAD